MHFRFVWAVTNDPLCRPTLRVPDLNSIWECPKNSTDSQESLFQNPRHEYYSKTT